MTDPVSKVEIEDVLSSIRRLVSEETRKSQAPAPADPPASQDKLVLTPALRVTGAETPGDTPPLTGAAAGSAAVPQTSDAGDMAAVGEHGDALEAADTDDTAETVDTAQTFEAAEAGDVGDTLANADGGSVDDAPLAAGSAQADDTADETTDTAASGPAEPEPPRAPDRVIRPARPRMNGAAGAALFGPGRIDAISREETGSDAPNPAIAARTAGARPMPALDLSDMPPARDASNDAAPITSAEPAGLAGDVQAMDAATARLLADAAEPDEPIAIRRPTPDDMQIVSAAPDPDEAFVEDEDWPEAEDLEAEEVTGQAFRPALAPADAIMAEDAELEPEDEPVIARDFATRRQGIQPMQAATSQRQDSSEPALADKGFAETGLSEAGLSDTDLSAGTGMTDTGLTDADPTDTGLADAGTDSAFADLAPTASDMGDMEASDPLAEAPVPQAERIEMGNTPLQPDADAPRPDSAAAAVEALTAKIAMLEAELARSRAARASEPMDEDEPADYTSPASTAETSQSAAENRWQTGAAAPEGGPEEAEQADTDAQPEYSDAEAQAEAAAALREAQEANADIFGTEETILDEETLRELVTDIVREELQGALGERITRNVRKLVRREIHRALAAQDLD